MATQKEILKTTWTAITSKTTSTPPYASREYVILHRKRQLIEDEVRALHAHLEAKHGTGSRFRDRLIDGMEKARPFSDPETFFSRANSRCRKPLRRAVSP